MLTNVLTIIYHVLPGYYHVLISLLFLVQKASFVLTFSNSSSHLPSD